MKVGMAILTSDEVDLRTKSINHGQRGTFHNNKRVTPEGSKSEMHS